MPCSFKSNANKAAEFVLVDAVVVVETPAWLLKIVLKKASSSSVVSRSVTEVDFGSTVKVDCKSIKDNYFTTKFYKTFTVALDSYKYVAINIASYRVFLLFNFHVTQHFVKFLQNKTKQTM